MRRQPRKVPQLPPRSSRDSGDPRFIERLRHPTASFDQMSKRSEETHRELKLGKRMARLITFMCLLGFLLGVCGIGCGIGKPPVMTLDQWQAEDDRVRSRP